MYGSSPAASWSESLRPSVPYPSVGLVVTAIHIRTFCDHFNTVFIFEPTGIGLSHTGPVRRECRTWFEGSTLFSFFCPASLPPSILSAFVRFASLPPSSPASLAPPCLGSTHLLLLPTVHSPSSLSIPAVRVEVEKQSALTSFSFHLCTRCLLVTYSVCQPLPRKISNEECPEKLFSFDLSIRRLKPSECVVKLSMVVASLYSPSPRRRSLFTLAKIWLVSPRPCRISFSNTQTPTGTTK